jgi:threonine/homoserine/homoserine lactone efflux protein
MFSFGSIGSVFFLMLGASAVPGPSDVLVMRQAGLFGFRRTLGTIAGIVLADAGFILAASLGLVSLSSLFPGLTGALRWIGLGVLLWLARQVWTSGAPSGSAPAETGWLAGFLVTLSDPTAIGFYAAVLPVLTGGEPVTPRDALVLFACAVTAILLVKCSLAVVAVRMRHALNGWNGLPALRRLGGVLFIAALMALFFFSPP